MNIKVLPLEGWMVRRFTRDKCTGHNGKPVVPLFNRPGIYMIGDQCWFEVDGEAWAYERTQFIYELQLLNAEHLNHKQIAALAAVCREGLASKAQRRLLHLCVVVASIRQTGRGARARFLAYKHERN